MLSFGRHLPVSVLGVVCAMGVVTAPPALGKEGAGQFTVLGRHDTGDEHSLTAAVSYRDLDLATRDGRAALRARVWKTAEKLCARIGESHINSATRALSCEDQAVYGASGQLQAAFAQARFAAAAQRQPTVASAGSRSDGAPAAGNPSLTVSVAAIR
jgi:UrcA family protein